MTRLNLKYWVIFLIVAALISCGELKQPVTYDPPINKLETPQVCYDPSPKDRVNCFNLVASANLQSVDEYDYRDPFSDSSFPAHFDPYQYQSPLNYVELIEDIAEKALAPNFQLNELMQSRKGQYAVFSRLALQQIQNIRSEVGQPIYITSGFRSPAYNKGISGSANWSRHMYGDAIDFFSDDVSLSELKELCKEQGASFTQTYRSHVHCDWRGTVQDEAFFGTPLPPNNDLHQRFVTLAEENSRIEVHETESHYELSINTDYIEDDPEEVTYLWQVTSSAGNVKNYIWPEIRLKKELAPYQVKLTLGDSLEISQDIP